MRVQVVAKSQIATQRRVVLGRIVEERATGERGHGRGHETVAARRMKTGQRSRNVSTATARVVVELARQESLTRSSHRRRRGRLFPPLFVSIVENTDQNENANQAGEQNDAEEREDERVSAESQKQTMLAGREVIVVVEQETERGTATAAAAAAARGRTARSQAEKPTPTQIGFLVDRRADLLVDVVATRYVAESGTGERAVDARRVLAQVQIICAHIC